jgi:hypothetical protein
MLITIKFHTSKVHGKIIINSLSLDNKDSCSNLTIKKNSISK